MPGVSRDAVCHVGSGRKLRLFVCQTGEWSRLATEPAFRKLSTTAKHVSSQLFLRDQPSGASGMLSSMQVEHADMSSQAMSVDRGIARGL